MENKTGSLTFSCKAGNFSAIEYSVVKSKIRNDGTRILVEPMFVFLRKKWAEFFLTPPIFGEKRFYHVGAKNFGSYNLFPKFRTLKHLPFLTTT
jgi:hypothetical protein